MSFGSHHSPAQTWPEGPGPSHPRGTATPYQGQPSSGQDPGGVEEVQGPERQTYLTLLTHRIVAPCRAGVRAPARAGLQGVPWGRGHNVHDDITSDPRAIVSQGRGGWSGSGGQNPLAWERMSSSLLISTAWHGVSQGLSPPLRSLALTGAPVPGTLAR